MMHAGETWHRPRLWAGSVGLVLSLHAGAMAAAVLWHSADEPMMPPAGAMMIELAPMAAPPPSQPTNVRPADAHPPEKREEPKPPPVKAEVALPKPKPKPKPQPVTPARTDDPIAETVVERTSTAAEAPAAPVAAAPAPGASPLLSGTAVPTWQGELRAHLERHKRYPAAAQFRRQQGVPAVRFTMNRDGRIVSARLERPCGNDLLDGEALALLERAQPLPPPPAEMLGEQIELVVPVQFFLR